MNRNSNIVTIVAKLEIAILEFTLVSVSIYFSSVRHQSRQWIIELLLAANGKHLFQKQVFDAQTPPMKMSYPAIRKLMREMLRSGLRRDKDGYYLIMGSNLTEKEINTAHRKELYAENKMLIERHRRQRHTVSSDVIWNLEELLKDERANSKSKQNAKSEIDR